MNRTPNDPYLTSRISSCRLDVEVFLHSLLANINTFGTHQGNMILLVLLLSWAWQHLTPDSCDTLPETNSSDLKKTTPEKKGYSCWKPPFLSAMLVSGRVYHLANGVITIPTIRFFPRISLPTLSLPSTPNKNDT